MHSYIATVIAGSKPGTGIPKLQNLHIYYQTYLSYILVVAIKVGMALLRPGHRSSEVTGVEWCLYNYSTYSRALTMSAYVSTSPPICCMHTKIVLTFENQHKSPPNMSRIVRPPTYYLSLVEQESNCR